MREGKEKTEGAEVIFSNEIWFANRPAEKGDSGDVGADADDADIEDGLLNG